ncbi:hypothetical protein B5E53_06845 [Eubacterium sp. An11]|nr:hypothetical protein B5E53_06845 [Eubacterium sp. An11]
MKRGAIRVVTKTGITNTCMTSANQFYFDHIITFLNRRTGAASCVPRRSAGISGGRIIFINKK